VASRAIHTIRHDDYHGGCILMRYLLQNGYRRIAYLGNGQAGEANAERQRAWREMLHAAQLEPQIDVCGAGSSIACGQQAARQLFEQLSPHSDAFPDAIYCYNDALAIGAMSQLRAVNMRIPEDVALTGFDDLDIAAVVEPPLTTMRQPRTQMGADATRLLLALIARSQLEVSIEQNGATAKDPARDTRNGKLADIPPPIRMAGELIIRRSA